MTCPEISPFKLLKAYGQEDLPLFFGRTGETRQLTEVLLQTKFILLYGASGTGKTSLIQCGLQGMFSPRDWMPLFVRRGNVGFVEAIREALSEQYAAYCQLLDPGSQPPPTGELSLRELIQALFNLAYVPVYLILDQFEEIFTLGTEAEQQEFFETLQALRLFEADLFCKVLIVAREEYIAHFYRFEKQLPFLFEHRFRIEKMREGQLEQVVRGTLEAVYPGYPAFRIEAGVPAQIMQNLSDERKEIDLTTLQVYLDRLYQEDKARLSALPAEASAKAGTQAASDRRDYMLFDAALVGTHKLSNILADFLDRQLVYVTDKIKALYPPAKKAAPLEGLALRILFKLVTAQGTKQNRSASEVHMELENGRVTAPLALVQQYLDELAGPETRILTRLRYAKTGEERFEMVHDRLAEVVFAKFNEEEFRQREASVTIENKQKRFGEAAGRPKAQRQEYLSLGELELVGQSLNIERLEAGEKAFFQESVAFHVRRRRRERWVIAATAIAALVFAIVALIAYRQSNLAKMAQTSAESRLFSSMALQALATDPTRSKQLADSAYRKNPDFYALKALYQAFYPDVFYFRDSIYKTPYGIRKEGHSSRVFGVCFSPDGRYFATTSNDSTVMVWETRSVAPICSVRLNAISRNIAFHPDGQRLLVGMLSPPCDITVLLFSAQARTLSVQWNWSGESDAIVATEYSPDGKYFLTAAYGGTITIRSTADCTITQVLPYPQILYVAHFSPDQKFIVATYADSTVATWNWQGKLIKKLKGPGSVFSLTMTTDQHYVFCGMRNGDLTVLDGRSAKNRWPEIFNVRGAHQEGAYTAQLFSDDRYLLSSSMDGNTRIWHWDSMGRILYPVVNLGGAPGVFKSAISPDGYTIVSTSLDKTVSLWRLNARPLPVTSTQSSLMNFCKAPDGEKRHYAFALVRENSLVLIDSLGQQKARYDLPNGNEAFAVDISLDGKIVIGTRDSGAMVFDRHLQRRHSLPHHEIVEYVRFSPDGRYILTAAYDSTAALWTSEGQLERRLPHGSVVLCANFSPDGQYILTGTREDKCAYIWDLQGHCLDTLQGHYLGIRDIRMSPRGDLMVTASWDNTLRLWDRAGRPLKILRGHAGLVNAVIFSEDGQFIISSSEDQTIKVWNRDGVELVTLKEIGFPVMGLYFDQKRKQIISATTDGNIKYWDLDPELLLQ